MGVACTTSTAHLSQWASLHWTKCSTRGRQYSGYSATSTLCRTRKVGGAVRCGLYGTGTVLHVTLPDIEVCIGPVAQREVVRSREDLYAMRKVPNTAYVLLEGSLQPCPSQRQCVCECLSVCVCVCVCGWVCVCVCVRVWDVHCSIEMRSD